MLQNFVTALCDKKMHLLVFLPTFYPASKLENIEVDNQFFFSRSFDTQLLVLIDRHLINPSTGIKHGVKIETSSTYWSIYQFC